MKWEEAYSGEQFKFSWKIADYFINGYRLEKPNDMNEDVYYLITQCWSKEPRDRLTIEDIIQKLETFN